MAQNKPHHIQPKEACPAMSKEPKVVVLWSVPRAISTAVERVMIEATDVHVLHERFGAPFYWGPDKASTQPEYPRSDTPDFYHARTMAEAAEQIFAAPLPEGKRMRFSKELAYYAVPHALDLVMDMCRGRNVQHAFLIRDPVKTIRSLYSVGLASGAGFDPVEAGFDAMQMLLQRIDEERASLPESVAPLQPLVMDSDELIKDPEGILGSFCAAAGLPFDRSMLTWEPGPVSPIKDSPFVGWTSSVLNSSGFSSEISVKSHKKRLDDTCLPPDVHAAIDDAMPAYNELRSRRLRPFAKAGLATVSSQPLLGRPPKWLNTTVGPIDVGSAPPRLPSDRAGASRGCLLVLAMVFLWVAEAKMLQTVQTDYEWQKPYLIGVALKAVWIVGAPLVYLMHRLQVGRGQKKHNVAAASADSSERLPLVRDTGVLPLDLSWNTMRFCGWLSMLVAVAAISWTASLSKTSTSSNSAIYQSSTVFAYVFSVPLLSERISTAKSIAVLLATGGILTVIFSDKLAGSDDARPDSLLGMFLVILSAMAYALKEVLFKRWMPTSQTPTPIADASLCVILIGAWCALMLGPWVLLCDASGLEEFELPPAEITRQYALVALMMGLYQVLLFAAIATTSPTFVAVGSLLVTPVSMLWDSLLLSYRLPPPAVAGVAAIIFAIVLVVYAEPLDSWLLTRLRTSASSACVVFDETSRFCAGACGLPPPPCHTPGMRKAGPPPKAVQVECL